MASLQKTFNGEDKTQISKSSVKHYVKGGPHFAKLGQGYQFFKLKMLQYIHLKIILHQKVMYSEGQKSIHKTSYKNLTNIIKLGLHNFKSVN